LLNPVVEQELVSRHTSDEDIYQAIIDMRNREEMLEVNGGDDDSMEELQEALEAAIILGKYVSDINDTYVQKLEKELAAFGRQTRIEQSHSMVPTKITQFFS
ncbi:hypothetical protein BDQ17DRAFT_1219099, partial [Cyathus striatus]